MKEGKYFNDIETKIETLCQLLQKNVLPVFSVLVFPTPDAELLITA